MFNVCAFHCESSRVHAFTGIRNLVLTRAADASHLSENNHVFNRVEAGNKKKISGKIPSFIMFNNVHQAVQVAPAIVPTCIAPTRINHRLVY